MRRYVVGYTATENGRDAVNLAVALARSQQASLDLVMVQSPDSPYAGTYPPSGRGYERILAEQLDQWLAEGLALVPHDVTAKAHVRQAESTAEGLIEAARDFSAAVIVVGAARSSLLRRFSVGSVSSTLLHAADVPVALAPKGYRRQEPITRLTCGIGTRPGADDVLQAAVGAASWRSLPLRLVSLVALDPDNPEAVRAAEANMSERFAAAAAQLPGKVTRTVAHGRTIEDAIEGLEWDEGELMMIGSSRLARNNRLFLGATANKVLRTLPVPMVVVPRNYRSDRTTPADTNKDG
ncbi:universal stress protein [Arthrobacter sp. VKM Ac-2550]|uniref:universal stress protein n=1 Tax=Crystallibacter permensis TaxID=1938888 RepID=UPI00222781B4|nr:universal stress protein [Arthrobacter sp. VKM Ac-2550]